jgi:KAP family P-loop domain/NB-ARC domain
MAGFQWPRRTAASRVDGHRGIRQGQTSTSDSPTADDLLGFRRLSEPLAERISEVPITETPWTIGLFGEWGAGKTSFMLMVDESLRRRKIEPVWFNAWKYSHEEILWTALLQTVLDRTRISGSAWRRPAVACRLWFLTLDVRAGTWEVVRKVGAFILRLSLFALAILLTASALSTVSGSANTAAHDFLAGQSWSNGILDQAWARGLLAFLAFLLAGPSVLWKAFDPHLRIDYSKFARRKSYAGRIAFIDEFSDYLKRIVRISGCGKPVVVMIDDLDRCLPEQVLQIIDAVKMFLDVPGCVFVLAVDRDIIEDAVELKYAQSASGSRLQKLRETYAERIIQMPLALPPALPGMARNFVRDLAAMDADIIECAPILIGVPPYNPRRIKRSIQTFALYRDLAPSGDNEPSLLPTLLAKLTVIQYHYRELYKAATGDGELLSTLEREYDNSSGRDQLDQKSAGLAEKYKLIYPDLPGLLGVHITRNDSFIDVSLDPYLSYFRSVAVVPEEDLSAEPQSLVAQPSRSSNFVPADPAVTTVDRPELTDMIVKALEASQQGEVGPLVALTGAGGYGKTYLARNLASDNRVMRRFNKGIFFVQLGPNIVKVDLAAKLNDLIAMMTGSQTAFTDPLMAGQMLGDSLNKLNSGHRSLFARRPRRSLLIVDDVWSPEQLAPFMIKGKYITRLITTRNPRLVPENGYLVAVDALSHNQAAAMIESGLSGIPRDLLDSLTSASGRWPLLASLMNSAIRQLVATGRDPTSAAIDVRDRLLVSGPAALDIANTFDRRRAVAATIDASLNMLADDDVARFSELGAFKEDFAIPLNNIERLWKETASLTSTQTQILVQRLADMSLVNMSSSGTVRVHDLIRDYIRSQLGPERVSHLARLIEVFEEPKE